jgi:poly-gamma-glutamate synthesis protein (capsule biosynthesis protein)
VLLAVFFQESLTTYPTQRTALSAPSDLQKLPEPTHFSSRLLFGGDIMLGRKVETTSLASTLSYAYPFSKLDSFEKDKYQAWIANLECPSTTTTVPYVEQTTYLRFNCPVEFLPELAKWFDVVSLSNNHTDNVNGSVGLAETRQHLDENDIQYFGHYDNSVTDDICEVVSVDAVLYFDDNGAESTKLPLALCGLHGVFKIPLDSEIASINKYAELLPTIVMPHMGAEYQASADSIREMVYRKVIDAGADAVIGNHPHWVQNTEIYKGKLIAYSMGNLIFDQQFSSEVQRSAMFDVTINAKFNENSAEWAKIAQGCAVFKDDCLRQAEAKGLDKLKVEFSYDVVPALLVDMVARRATGSVAAGVLDRTNWEITSDGLE